MARRGWHSPTSRVSGLTQIQRGCRNVVVVSVEAVAASEHTTFGDLDG
jgi:hypothetical protein